MERTEALSPKCLFLRKFAVRVKNCVLFNMQPCDQERFWKFSLANVRSKRNRALPIKTNETNQPASFVEGSVARSLQNVGADFGQEGVTGLQGDLHVSVGAQVQCGENSSKVQKCQCTHKEKGDKFHVLQFVASCFTFLVVRTSGIDQCLMCSGFLSVRVVVMVALFLDRGDRARFVHRFFEEEQLPTFLGSESGAPFRDPSSEAVES